jgi:multicomponent Na+:H+ antiporter subunit D
MSVALVVVLALPLGSALVAAGCPRRFRGLVGCLGVLGVAVASVLLAIAVGRSGPVEASWDGPGDLALVLVADGLAVTMLLMTAITAVGIATFALVEDGRGEGRPRPWWPLWLVLVWALHVLFLAGDLITVYLAFEVIGVVAAGLVVLGGGRRQHLAGMRYLYAELVATTIVLFGVAVIWRDTGTLVISQLTGAGGGAGSVVALALVTAGLLFKVPLVPVHLWLPGAHALAPSAVSPLLSAVVVKAGFVVVVRLWFDGLPGLITPAAVSLVGGLGVVAVVWGSLMALRAREIKVLIAYSTLAQIGFAVALVPLAFGGARTAWTGGLLHAVAHAPAKAAMLLGAAVLVSSADDPTVAGLRGAVRRRPLAVFAVGLGAVSLVGLPPSGGFVAKWYLVLGALEVGSILWLVVIAGGSLLTAAYAVRILSPTFATDGGEDGHGAVGGRDVAAFALALVTLLLGLRPLETIGLLETVAPVGTLAGAG